MMDTQGSVSRSHSRAWKDIPLAICLAVVFVSFSALRLIGDSDSIVGSQAALQSVLTGPILHTKLARNIALFVSAHVLLTVLFGLICWAAGVISESAWRTAGLSRRAWVLIWSVLGWASVLVANAAMYPWSLLGEPYAGLATIEWRGISLFELWSVLVLGFAGASILRVAWRTHAQSSTLIRLGVTSSALAAALP